jgi:hypothetical protein
VENWICAINDNPRLLFYLTHLQEILHIVVGKKTAYISTNTNCYQPKRATILSSETMRHISKFILFFFLTIISLSGISQDSTAIQETQVKLMLCRNWKAVSMEANGRKAIVTKSSVVSFSSDGKFADTTQGLGKTVGSWTYNHSTKTLETTDKGGKSKAKLVEVTSDTLVMELEYPEFVTRVTYSKAD